MRLTVLTENTAGGRFTAEHGLSYLIEHNGKRILFDTGHSDTFIKNAKKLKIDIDKTIDTVVLSHGHWDHGDGLRFIRDKKLITHPNSFIKRYRKTDKSNIGLSLSKSDIEKQFKLIVSEFALNITDDIIFLGEIPRTNSFESQTTTFIDDNNNDDFVTDDSGLAIVQNNELIIISGCAHSGICNIISHAIEITKITKVKAVVGGFHLKHNNLQTKKTIEYLEKLDIQHLYPSHCTELPALSAFYNTFNIKQLKTGNILEF
jgi:7,8-dihydropterin-6-yl-methyl-4-(beta-D-ribofuranosyl)aminobenzene 5'-phosphate synthase